MANSLEKVVKSGIQLANISQIAGNVDYHKYVGGFLQYLASTGRDPSLFPGLGQNPEALGRLAEEAVGEERKKLVESVSQNFEEVAKGLSPEQVFQLVYSDKSYNSLAEALSSGDIDKVRKSYLEEHKGDSLLSKYIAMSTDDALVKSASRHLQGKRAKFIIENLSDKKGERDKTEFAYNPEKAAKLLSDCVAKLKDKERDNFYLAVGQYFTQNALGSKK